MAHAALAHRVALKPEMWLRRATAADVVAAVLSDVPAPPTAAQPSYVVPRSVDAPAPGSRR